MADPQSAPAVQQRTNRTPKDETTNDNSATDKVLNGHPSNSNKISISKAAEPQQVTTTHSLAKIISTSLIPPSSILTSTLLLIFGGCCSNVYTLEAILAISPDTGSLITFVQFVLTSAFFIRTQIQKSQTLTTTEKDDDHDTSNDNSEGKKQNRDKDRRKASIIIPGLKRTIVPLSKWIIYTIFFASINLLNNAAFAYRISIPLHIILRSAGPVTSMLIGRFVGGKRYSRRKITAVVLLFAGVVLAALSDAQSKQKPNSFSTTTTTTSEEQEDTARTGTVDSTTALKSQTPGFILLILALLLSATYGLYTDTLYEQYGRSDAITNENLFYSHFLSLPIFALRWNTLKAQYLSLFLLSRSSQISSPVSFLPSVSQQTSTLRSLLSSPIILLLLNASTQILCITGVNRLSTQTTSLTVSIVLNIRKLVSLLISIVVFGNRLSGGVVLGAGLVGLGVGMYAVPDGKKSLPSGERGRERGEERNEKHGIGDGRVDGKKML